MQLDSRDGIACDHCGMTYRSDFEYYSWDFHHVSVMDGNRVSRDVILRSQVVFSLDVCTACFHTFKLRIVENYKKSMTADRSKSSPHVCEITGKVMSGTYDYYYCNISKVDVRITGQPSVCVNCQHRTSDDGKQCSKCGGVEFIKPASMDIDQHFVEISLCTEAFENLVNKAKSVRKLAGQWSTKS